MELTCAIWHDCSLRCPFTSQFPSKSMGQGGCVIITVEEIAIVPIIVGKCGENGLKQLSSRWRRHTQVLCQDCPEMVNRAEILRPVKGPEVLRDLEWMPPQWGVWIPGFKFLNCGYLKLLLSCAHWDFQSLLNVERVPGIKTLSVKKVGVITSCIALPGRSFWTSASEDVSPVVRISFIHFLELFDHGIP